MVPGILKVGGVLGAKSGVQISTVLYSKLATAHTSLMIKDAPLQPITFPNSLGAIASHSF